jgi:hypothetical protein
VGVGVTWPNREVTQFFFKVRHCMLPSTCVWSALQAVGATCTMTLLAADLLHACHAVTVSHCHGDQTAYTVVCMLLLPQAAAAAAAAAVCCSCCFVTQAGAGTT